MVKSDTDIPTGDSSREWLQHLETDPYADWVRRVFEASGVGYGRLDYGVADGSPQAWEINLNPTIGQRLGKPSRSASEEVKVWREAARELSHRLLREAFVALDDSTSGPTDDLKVSLPASLLTRARGEAMRSRTRRSLVRIAAGLFHSPLLGKPLRAIYSRFVPRF